MPKPAPPPLPPESDQLVEEMLGTAGPPLPDTPVLLGEFTNDEAAAMGAMPDDALDDTPEIRGLGKRYQGPRRRP